MAYHFYSSLKDFGTLGSKNTSIQRLDALLATLYVISETKFHKKFMFSPPF